ncbi:cyclopentanone -monooxygenase [Moniliophthora roreri MCA 2997]|uniref:Cyclopentanone-monooxygenase n=1 Tax=Moniliophthora roreri (strain MCA 2997) TaxID=1381753 RepID=V2WRP7_MONRO|nr:cyclopentanone -monooxygenase [Moniliophthora roreri MCA 2997]
MANTNSEKLDIVIVGAGFAGIHQLIRLRKLGGLSIQVLEEASDLGGLWYWNNYPGKLSSFPYSSTHTDSLPFPEVYEEWDQAESFATRDDILRYFRIVDNKFDVKRDIRFNSKVVSAHWDGTNYHWNTITADGAVFHSKYLLLCIGFAAKMYIPDWKGVGSFKGTVYHTSRWPQEGADFKGKRVGVIGTGATGVQVIQTIFDQCDSLTVFQRTPNIALPMRLLKLNKEDRRSDHFPTVLHRRLQTFAGFSYDFLYDENPFDVPPEERELHFEKLWEKGGLRFWLATYSKIFYDPKIGQECYEFWRRKTAPRVKDPAVRELLVPSKPLHHFGIRRHSLEQRYYEAFNHPTTKLVDIRGNAIEEITPKGVKTADGTEYEFDILIFATGFDAMTGGMRQIDIRGRNGLSLLEKWNDATRTCLGMAINGFPNMFFVYGPQAPSAFANGPSCIDVQSEWVTRCIDYMEKNGCKTIDATPEAEEEWTNLSNDLMNKTLFLDVASSWHTGSNIPGKRVEALNFFGGLPMYVKKIGESADSGYTGFIFEQ